MIRFYLLAHAPTAAQRLARFPADEAIDPVDPAITRRLLARIGRVDTVRRGPERRAEETATALGPVATPCADLRAWSAGAWSGQTIAWVLEHDPEGFQAWRTDPESAPNGGESLRTLAERVASWLTTQALLTANGRLLVIADPAVIRAALLAVLDAPLPTFWRLDVPPLSLSIVQYANNAWRLRQLNVEYGVEPTDSVGDGT